MTIVIGQSETTLITIWTIICIILATFGWLYAEKVTLRPLKRTWLEVVIGCSVTMIGQFALGWAVAHYLGISSLHFIYMAIIPAIPAWAITGLMMIYWQQWKHQQDEEVRKVHRDSRKSAEN